MLLRNLQLNSRDNGGVSPFSLRFILKGVTASCSIFYINTFKKIWNIQKTNLSCNTQCQIFTYTHTTFAIKSVTYRPHWRTLSQRSVLNHTYLYIELGWFKGTPDFHFSCFLTCNLCHAFIVHPIYPILVLKWF